MNTARGAIKKGIASPDYWYPEFVRSLLCDDGVYFALLSDRQRARGGEVKDFTGISSPYEPPINPELVVKTGELPLAVCVDQIVAFLFQRGILVGTGVSSL